MLARITPACAGKTIQGGANLLSFKDHPRMRGEDLHCHDGRVAYGRITPACAGKTRRFVRCRGSRRDHPRMRGEDLRFRDRVPGPLGSPPHARGRPKSRRR